MTDEDVLRQVQFALATEALAAVTRKLQAEGYPVRTILAAALGLATCELIAVKGPAEAAERLREAAEICQRAADRGDAGPLAEAEAMGQA